jgi:RNA polymerase sigma factor (sigma-70 family)
MKSILEEQNSLMERILRDYGSLIRGAVHRATQGLSCSDDVLSEVYFAVLLTVRKLGTGWTPPRSFIFSVVRNKVNDFLRHKYRENRGVEEMKKRLAQQAAQKEEVISKIDSLSSSEFRVFRLLGMGMTNGEIAESLCISLYTVRSHMKKVHAKCGIRDRSKLTLLAHLVCHQPQRDGAGEEKEKAPSTSPSLPRRRPQSRPESRRPELWAEGPPLLPIAITPWTKYCS